MIVLDASALVDVLVDNPSAGWVLEQLGGEEVCAPAHQPAEVLSAISRLRRAGTLDIDAAESAVEEATELDQQLVLPTRELLQRALALDGRIRVLGALYVALAERGGWPLVTTDTRLFRAGVPCEVRTPSNGS